MRACVRVPACVWCRPTAPAREEGEVCGCMCERACVCAYVYVCVNVCSRAVLPRLHEGKGVRCVPSSVRACVRVCVRAHLYVYVCLWLCRATAPGDG